jgi:vancomycin aglycone glucosyltransferase
MRALLSTIGSRGDVQPLAALAMALRELGHDVRLCVPPDFQAWLEGLGFAVTPLGPILRTHGATVIGQKPTPEQLRRLGEESVATQFTTLGPAADGCDVIVAGGALQIAAHSIAEQRGLRYVYASYCPCTLPSAQHPPPVIFASSAAGSSDHAALWRADAERWNQNFGPVLNAQRRAIGLGPVDDVRGYIFTQTPWLAADMTLGPWPGAGALEVVQTGAWILHDQRPLAPELEAFLGAGEPPIYFGFGSMRVAPELGGVVLDAARALGRRALVQRGWAELSGADNQPDCLCIGEVNQQALFARVGAVVHHGGAGTTFAASAAGAPQVVVPQNYDQPYWAARVEQLGIGHAHAQRLPTRESLVAALRLALSSETAVRARELAPELRRDGAAIAAHRLLAG